MTTLAVLRAEIDTVLADWAWHIDHAEYDDLVELFTEDALFISGAAELRGRAAIKNRYTERTVVRSTRHTYSGLRLSPADGDFLPGPGSGTATDTARPALVLARSTWVNYAVNAAAPVSTGPIDNVGVYLVADFYDTFTWCPDSRWRISERRIIPVFRDPVRAPVTA